MEICDMVIQFFDYINLPLILFTDVYFSNEGRTDRNRDDEIIKLLQSDSFKEDDMTSLW